MNNLFLLLKGEIIRAQKYKVLAASLVIPMFWIVILVLIGSDDVTDIFPLLVYFDVTAMAMLYIGVTMMFEKQEKTLVSLIVAPIKKSEYYVSKIAANLVFNFISFSLLYTYVHFFKTVNINLALLIVFLIFISVFHSILGFIVATKVKTFTNFLVTIMTYILILSLPVLLEQINLITNELIINLMYILPTKSSMLLITSTIEGLSTSSFIAVGYLFVLGGILIYIVNKTFSEYIIKESGA